MPSKSANLDLTDLLARAQAVRLPAPAVRRDLRTSAGISLREGAGVLGVAPMSFLRWERGQVTPRPQHAIAYRQFLDALRQQP